MLPNKIKFLTKTVILLATIIFLFASAFVILKLDSSSTNQTASEKIIIEGDLDCKKKTMEALDLLKQKSPQNYLEVETYIGIIECQPTKSGMYAMEKPPRFVVGNATRDAGAIWYASAIVHDAIHSKLYSQYALSHPGQLVPADVWIGQQAENQCLKEQYKALQDLGADTSTLNYLSSKTNSDYWEQPNRNW